MRERAATCVCATGGIAHASFSLFLSPSLLLFSCPLQYGMQFDQMSMGSGMEAAPWKRVNIDRAKWKVAARPSVLFRL